MDFDAVFYSLDWHPSDHVSFIDNIKQRPIHPTSPVSVSLIFRIITMKIIINLRAYIIMQSYCICANSLVAYKWNNNDNHNQTMTTNTQEMCYKKSLLYLFKIGKFNPQGRVGNTTLCLKKNERHLRLVADIFTKLSQYMCQIYIHI